MTGRDPVASTMWSVRLATSSPDASRSGDHGTFAHERRPLTREVGGVAVVIEVFGDLGSTSHRFAPRTAGRGVMQHRLRRHARNERAFTTDEVVFEDDDAHRRVGEFGDQRLGSGATSDDGDVDVRACDHV